MQMIKIIKQQTAPEFLTYKYQHHHYSSFVYEAYTNPVLTV